ncbi:MAG TPA: ABC transporter permease [Minicystis sp.]|nr:ABC transporter permease [Minicystis sp.]
MSAADALRALGNVARKEMLQTLRDRRVVFVLVVAPILQLVLLGYAVNLDVDRVPAVVCDEDRTPASRVVADELFAGDTFVSRGEVPDADAAQRALESGDATVAVVIPRGFARRAGRRERSDVQILVDATDAARSQVASQHATSILSMAGAAAPPVVTSVLYNPRLETPVYMVPGILATLLLAVTTFVTAMGLARERETGTLEQVLVAPIRPAVLLGGKLVPYLFFGLVDVIAVLLLGGLLFHVPFRGPAAVIAVGAFLYVFSTLGLGVFVATLSTSQQQAMLGSFGIVLPAMLLSGFITPIASMPAWLRPVTLAIPMRHFIEIARRCLLKGAGFDDLAFQLAALAVLGAALLGSSVALFRRRVLS